jgi:hypothetical protein
MVFHDFSSTTALAEIKEAIFQRLTTMSIGVSKDFLFRQNKIYLSFLPKTEKWT